MRPCERAHAERGHRQLRGVAGDARGWPRRVRRRVQARRLLRTRKRLLARHAFLRQRLRAVARIRLNPRARFMRARFRHTRVLLGGMDFGLAGVELALPVAHESREILAKLDYEPALQLFGIVRATELGADGLG